MILTTASSSGRLWPSHLLVAAIEAGGLLRDEAHPQVGRFGHQRVFWARLNGQVWVIPYVLENDHGCFLKTAYPSRKAAQFLRGGQDAKD